VQLAWYSSHIPENFDVWKAVRDKIVGQLSDTWAERVIKNLLGINPDTRWTVKKAAQELDKSL